MNIKKDPKFGYETIGGSAYTPWDASGEYITGYLFTCPDNGTADSITVALKRAAAGSNNAKCAIYKHSDLSLVGVTEQVNVSFTTSFAWYTFNFTAPKPSLVANTDYILMVWCDYTTSPISVAYDAGETDKHHYRTDLAYNSFPNPLGTYYHWTYKHSIYCSYTPAGVAYSQTISEILGMVDSIPAPKASFKQAVSEVLGMVDSVVPKWAAHLTVSDSLGMVDSVAKPVSFKQAISESLGMVDSTARKKAAYQTITETLGLSDSVSTKTIFKRVITEIMGLLDSVESLRIKKKTRLLAATRVLPSTREKEAE